MGLRGPSKASSYTVASLRAMRLWRTRGKQRGGHVRVSQRAWLQILFGSNFVLSLLLVPPHRD